MKSRLSLPALWLLLALTVARLPQASADPVPFGLANTGRADVGWTADGHATLELLVNPNGPVLVTALAEKNLTNILATFSAILDTETVMTTNFEVFAQARPDQRLDILSATLTNGSNVVLSTGPRLYGWNYTLQARGVAAAGASSLVTTSAVALRYVVDLVAIDTMTLWRYFEDGWAPHPDWQDPTFADFGWPEGAGLFHVSAFPQTLPEPVRTGLNLNDATQPNRNDPFATNRVLAAYFRTRFDLPGPLDGAVRLRHIVDDGAVFYLNGTEVYSFRMPTNRPLAYTTLASSPVSTASYVPPLSQPPVSIENSPVGVGSNLFAVELHQFSAGGADATFGATLEATLLYFGPGAALTTPPFLAEEAGMLPGGGVIALRQPWVEDLTFQLNSSLPAELLVPASVTVAAGATVASFGLTVVDDTTTDGPQMVTLTATCAGHPTISRALVILDNESTNLALGMVPRVVEGQGLITNAGLVSIQTLLPTNLVVTIESSVPDRLAAFPATIPAGQTSAVVTLNVSENAVPDGSASIQLTARAGGFDTAEGIVSVTDNDPYRFVFGPISSPYFAGSNIAVRLSAVEASGTAVPFFGTVTLSATGAVGSVPVSPTSLGPFTNGQWGGFVMVPMASPDVQLVASYTHAESSLSNPFDVEAAPVILTLLTRDLAYDRWREVLYASVPTGGGTYTNSVVTINPTAGSVVSSLPLGEVLYTTPTKSGALALTDDSRYLYVAVNRAKALRRVHLATQTVSDPWDLGGVMDILDLETLPGHPDWVAVLRRFATESVDLAILEAGMARSNSAWSPVTTLLTTGTNGWSLYGYGNSPQGRFPFHRFLADTNGVTLLDSTVGLMTGAQTDIVSDGGLVFGTTGGLVDPTVPARIGSFPASGLVAPDVANERVFFLSVVTNHYLLQAFDLWTQRPRRSLAFPVGLGTPSRFLRWGTNGLVFSTTGGQVYFVRSPRLFSDGKIVDLAIVQTNSPATLGSNFAFTVTLSNRGSNQAHATVLSDTLPTNTVYVTAHVSQGTVLRNGGLLTWQAGNLAPGTSATLRLEVNPQVGGWTANEARVAANELDLESTDSTSRQVVFVGQSVDAGTVRRFSLTCRDLAYDPVRRRLYATEPGNSQGRPNSLITLNPLEGSLIASSTVGNEPGRMALAEGARWLYVASTTNQGVQRFDLDTDTLGPAFLLNSNTPAGVTLADLKVLQDHPESVAVIRLYGGSNADVAVYDDGVARSNAAPSHVDGYTELLAQSDDPTLLFLQNHGVGGFRKYRITAEGTELIEVSTALNTVLNDVRLAWGDGVFYTTEGRLIDPVSFTLSGTISGFPGASQVCYDRASQRVFYLVPEATGIVSLRAYAARGQIALGSLTISGVVGVPESFVRWGADGLAFRTTGDQLFLLRTSLLPTNPPADLVLSLATSPSPYFSDSDITHTIVLSNAGPNAAVGVVWTNVLPSGAVVVSAGASHGTVLTNGSVVTGTAGALASGATAIFNVTYRVPTPGIWTSTIVARSQSIDPAEANNAGASLLWVHPPATLPGSGGFALATKDMVLDPLRQRLYASLGQASGPAGNGVIALDLQTGLLSQPLWTGGDPGRLALSADGHLLYVALDATRTVQRLNLASGVPDLQFPLQAFSSVSDMAVCPTNSDLVAIRRSSGTVSLYEHGVKRPVDLTAMAAFAFSDVTGGLYACDSYSDTPLYRVDTGPAGLTFSGSQPGKQSLCSEIKFSRGRLFFSRGMIVDPEARRFRAVLPQPIDPGNRFNSLVEPDLAGGRIFMLAPIGGSTWALLAYDSDQFVEVGRTNLTGVNGTPTRFLRWGTDGFAFCTDTQLFLLRSPLAPTNAPTDLVLTAGVTPAEAPVGAPVTYTLTTTNLGPHPAVVLVLTQAFSLAVTGVTANATRGAVTHADGFITWLMDALAPGAGGTLTVQVQPAQTGTLVMRAAVRHEGNDPRLFNNAVLQATRLGSSAPDLAEIGLVTGELLYDPFRDCIYASVRLGTRWGGSMFSSSGESFFANTILILDPATGNPVAGLPVGPDPEQMALSDDGHYLYVSLNGTMGAQRIDLLTGVPDLEFPFSVDELLNAFDLKVQPGHPETIAVSLVSTRTSMHYPAGVTLFDGGVPRPVTAGGTTSVEFSSDGRRLYGSITFGAGYGFLRLEVAPEGLRVLDVDGSFYNDYELQMENGLLYTALGRVVDPNLPLLLTTFGVNGPVAPDSGLGRIFQIPLSDSTHELDVFEMGTCELLGTSPLPGVRPYARQLIRCGGDRLAFRTEPGQLFILRTPWAAGTTRLPADLAVAQDATQDGSFPTAALTFSVTVTNRGPGAATAVTLAADPPRPVASWVLQVSQGICVTNNGKLLCQLGALEARSGAVLRILATITNSSRFTNLVSLSGNAPDPDLSNNVSLRAIEVLTDTDRDGLPDDWELAHGLDPGNPTDADSDHDGDGHTARQEYLAGTDPADRDNVLRFVRLRTSGAAVEVTFASVLGRRYAVEQTSVLPAENWSVVVDGVPGTGALVTLPLTNALQAPVQFYRVRVLP